MSETDVAVAIAITIRTNSEARFPSYHIDPQSHFQIFCEWTVELLPDLDDECSVYLH